MEYMTISEVAELLRVHKLTIYRYINANKLPAYKIGRDYRIKKSDFDAFMESSKAK